MNQKIEGLTRVLRHSAAITMGLLVAFAAQAQTAIESVTGSVSGGAEMVRIDLEPVRKFVCEA